MARLRQLLLGLLLVCNTVACQHRARRRPASQPPPAAAEPRPPLQLAEPQDVTVPTGSLSGAFAVSHDGETMAFGASDGSILLVPTRGGAVRVLARHAAPVTVAAFTRDGQTLVSGGDDRHLVVWDLAKGEPRCDVLAHTGEVKALALSPDGTLAATGSVADDIKIWRIRDGSLAQRFPGTSAAIYDLTFAPTGQLVFSASRDSQVRRWSLDKGKLEGMPLSFANSLVAMRWSPDHATLFVVDLQGMLLWIDPGEMKERHRRRVSPRPAVALDVAPDGTIVVGDAGGYVGLWSPVEKLETPLSGPFPAHEGAVRGLRVLPGGAAFVTLGLDGRLRRWELAVGTPSGRAPAVPPINGSVRAAAGHPTAARVAIASGGRLYFADGPGPDLGPGGVSSVAWAGDGRRLFVGRDTGALRVLSGDAPFALLSEQKAHQGAVRAIVPSGDGRTLWTAGDDNVVRELDAATLQPLRSIADHTSPIVALAVDPTGRRIATSEEEHITFVRLLEPSEIEWSLRREGLSALAFSPDGALLAAVQKDTTVALFDLGTHKRLRSLDAKSGVVTAIAFHPGGDALLALDAGGTLRVFATADGVEIANGQGPRGRATALAVGNGGRLVFTGGMDPTGSVKTFSLR